MSTRPWLYGVAGAVVATAATIAAFAVLDDDTVPASNPEPAASSPASQEPSEAPTPTETPSADEPVLETVPVYYQAETGRGPRLFREFHEVDTGGEPAVAAVREALTADPLDRDFRTPWAGLGADVGSVTHEGGTITVDLESDQPLRERPPGMSQDVAAMAVEQVLYTVQGALQSRDPVQLLVDGERSDQVLGVPAAEPLAQGDETATLAQVWIITPQSGDIVRAGSEVEGVGAFFEANVVWELRRDTAGGEVVESGFTTAEQCCTMAPYAFELPDVPAGQYVLVVKDQDMSDGEGPPPFEDTKQITIR